MPLLRWRERRSFAHRTCAHQHPFGDLSRKRECLNQIRLRPQSARRGPEFLVRVIRKLPPSLGNRPSERSSDSLLWSPRKRSTPLIDNTASSVVACGHEQRAVTSERRFEEEAFGIELRHKTQGGQLKSTRGCGAVSFADTTVSCVRRQPVPRPSHTRRLGRKFSGTGTATEHAPREAQAPRRSGISQPLKTSSLSVARATR